MQQNIKIILPAKMAIRAFFIPFPGERQELSPETEGSGAVSIIPVLLHGAIVYFE